MSRSAERETLLVLQADCANLTLASNMQAGLELTSPPHAGGEVNSFSSQLSPKNPHSFGSEKDEGVKPTASGRFYSFRNAGGAPSLRSAGGSFDRCGGRLKELFGKSSLRIFKNFLDALKIKIILSFALLFCLNRILIG